ncbi:reverse transcriptase domain-containing protein [Tanacetum coccineum]
MEFLSTDLLTTYKGLMEKTYTWIEEKEVATNRAPNDHRKGFDRFNKGSPWYNKGKKKNKDRFSLYRGSNHGLLSNLSKSPKEILATEKGVETPDRRSHKNRETRPSREKNKEGKSKGINNSSNSVIIKARIFERQVNRVYMDSGNSCEVIYEHCFLKLKPFIRSLRVDLKVPLVGFSGEHSWPLRDVPLEIIIGDIPFTRTENLTFVIVRSNSPHNLLLGRTTMQKMGIVVSTIHRAIKFHIPSGIGTIFLTYEPNTAEERQKKLKEILLKVEKGFLNCADAEGRIFVNNKYLKQTIVIGKQLPTNIKRKLQDLLRFNADIFAWTYTIGINNHTIIIHEK